MAELRFGGAQRGRQTYGRTRRPAPEKTQRRRKAGPIRFLTSNFGLIALGMVVGLAGTNFSPGASSVLPLAVTESVPDATKVSASQHFPICGTGRRVNCVVDGDTFYFRGEKIRVADINTPEVSQPKCATEARLGAQAMRRFQALLNAGPIEIRRSGARDEDRYGRKLRTVHRDGRSLGDTLVAEGLAHPWRGYKEDWCA